MVQANEMRGKYVATEGVVFHPEGTFALGDSEWVVIYDVHARFESFDKKGLEVVHFLQEQVTLLNVTMGHLAEHESEISALMVAAGQMRREKAQLRKVFNDSWTHLAKELLFLQKVTSAEFGSTSLSPRLGTGSRPALTCSTLEGKSGVKDNVTIVLQFPGKRIGGIGLPQVLPAAGVIKIPRLCSAVSDEWVLQASFRQMMPVNVTSVIDEEAAGMLSGLLAPVVEQSQPVTKSPIMEEAVNY
ncbi:hypothetical protein OUZ56_026603 [Daphnia magna]|uniref:Uncharacterized protein n=1 Tax=Daphnia magna TaxID=35525 RepID=A0ABQ9ZMA0_9CRUS|nr:hypothetical protein OUZ56_026603 [Daphnia magna]